MVRGRGGQVVLLRGEGFMEFSYDPRSGGVYALRPLPSRAGFGATPDRLGLTD